MANTSKSNETRPDVMPEARRAPGAPVAHPATAEPRGVRTTVPTVEPPQRQTLPADKAAGATSSAAAQSITSESNFNQAKTPQEHRASQQAATNEAAAQVAAAGPGGLPLPTSGQPLTKPAPDADYGDDRKK